MGLETETKSRDCITDDYSSGAGAMKKERCGIGATTYENQELRVEAGAMFMKRRATKPSCVIFTTAPQPWLLRER